MSINVAPTGTAEPPGLDVARAGTVVRGRASDAGGLEGLISIAKAGTLWAVMGGRKAGLPTVAVAQAIAEQNRRGRDQRDDH